MKFLLSLLLLFTTNAALADSRNLTAEVWVDNWFEMYVNGEKVVEDSVPITTERSFNAETATFTAELPVQIAIQAKDFKENDTGLEYIGTARQQMGDGGMIFQIRDAESGEVLGVSDQSVRCLVIHHAPIDTSCASDRNPVEGQGACASDSQDVPAGWTDADFDDSRWKAAVEHSESDVRPKDGYNRVSWEEDAKLIWSGDLVQDNTVLCRLQLNE